MAYKVGMEHFIVVIICSVYHDLKIGQIVELSVWGLSPLIYGVLGVLYLS